MNFSKKIKKGILVTLHSVATNSAKKGANTACLLWQNQPKETDKIKKLRKF